MWATLQWFDFIPIFACYHFKKINKIPCASKTVKSNVLYSSHTSHMSRDYTSLNVPHIVQYNETTARCPNLFKAKVAVKASSNEVTQRQCQINCLLQHQCAMSYESPQTSKSGMHTCIWVLQNSRWDWESSNIFNGTMFVIAHVIIWKLESRMYDNSSVWKCIWKALCKVAGSRDLWGLEQQQ